jgi:hypothetical protein
MTTKGVSIYLTKAEVGWCLEEGKTVGKKLTAKDNLRKAFLLDILCGKVVKKVKP